MTSTADDVLAPLCGLPVWGARLDGGAAFYLELGDDRDPDDDRHARYSLWVASAAWRLVSPDGWAGSGDDAVMLAAALDRLNGRVVERATCLPFGELELEFSGGVWLRTFSDHSSADVDPWDLFMPDVIVVGVARPGATVQVEPREGATR